MCFSEMKTGMLINVFFIHYTILLLPKVVSIHKLFQPSTCVRKNVTTVVII